MNKTKKNGTFILLKIVFPVRGYQKESLKQSMMIEKQCVIARNSLLLECILGISDKKRPKISCNPFIYYSFGQKTF